MSTAPKRRRRSSSSADSENELILKRLNKILSYFQGTDGKGKKKIVIPKALPSYLSGLGNVPFAQKKVAAWLRKNNQSALKDLNESALKTRVQRCLADLKAADADVAKVFTFRPHSTVLKSPNLSKAAVHSRLDDQEKRLVALEAFKRRFEAMLATGRPEPDVRDDAEK